jgi:GT2 family glycosyltransferase
MNHPKVSIIILNWNRQFDTLGCLKTLAKINYPNYDIILIDNGSTDDSVRFIHSKYPHINIIENEKNLGFAEGNNIGIKYALEHEADYILMLNNDTLVERDFLNYLINTADENEFYHVFGPQIRLYPQKNQYWYAGGRFWRWLCSVQLFGRGQQIGIPKFETTRDVTFIPGTALLVHRNVIEKIGLLDKNYFCYWEEVDWELRMLAKGIKFMYVPHSIVWHKVGKTSGGFSNPINQYYNYRNWLYLGKKLLPKKYYCTWILFMILRVFVFELPYALISLIFLRYYRIRNWLYIFIGAFDFFKGRMGKKI